MKTSSSVEITSGTLRQKLITGGQPAHSRRRRPGGQRGTSEREPAGPGMRTATYAQHEAPSSTWPSWPMFASPALLATIVPTATTSSGAAVLTVSPHAPGERRLPSSRAVNTFSPTRRSRRRAGRTARARRRSTRRPRTSATVTHGVAHRTGAARPPGMTGAASTTASGSSLASSLTPPPRPSAARGARGRPRVRAISPTIRPRWMTQIRWDSARISSSSVEMSSTPTPDSAAARSRAPMYSMAPTSRPRVGCAATSTRRLRRQLAGQDDPLLVAARQRAASACRARAR